MNKLFSPLLAAADTAVATNQPNALIKPNSGWIVRFEEATGLPHEVVMWSVNVLIAIVLLIIGYIIAGVVRSTIRRLFARRNIDATVGGFVGNLVHAIVMTFVIITVLGQLGIDTKTFAAVMAAAGLAIGLALQGGLSNFAAGFLIVAFRPFRAGDVINGAGMEGTVEEVQIFSTTLNTVDNKKIIIPNSALMAGTITNFTTNQTRRVDLPMAVGAGQDLAKAHTALLELANADPRVLKNPPPTVANTKLIDLGTQVELRAWCKTADYAALSSDFVAKAPAALAAAEVKGPDRTVYYVERK